ncbi:HlyD family secretion protein [Pendulispora brunnea]|uniref:HlyD family secretion protein n=1 Tax=Pendulispora brunnea TaxID=2905690 RepID=A0ABZ2K1N5_9BACT
MTQSASIDSNINSSTLTDAPAAEVAEAPAQTAQPQRRRRIMMGVAALAIAAGGAWYVAHRGLETTDNAQIDTNIVAVPARTAGTVAKILFTENQQVHAGDVLAELDDAPAKARLAQAEASVAAAVASAEAADADAQVAETNAVGNKSFADASLQTAVAGVATTQDQIKEREALVQSAEANLAQAKLDRERAKSLFDSGAIAKANFDQADTAYNLAQANLDAARSRLTTEKLSVAQNRSKVAEADAKAKQANNVPVLVRQARARAAQAHAQVATAQAQRDLAALDLSYTKIVAPHDGVVSKKTINEGQNVALGQTIVQLVTPEIYLTGNFKETQVTNMRVGQPAHFSVDAFPGREFEGEIESLSGATGSRFTLLPPDNATGNFTKIVQRLPVRVKLHAAPDGIVLRPGMSVDLTVDTRK